MKFAEWFYPSRNIREIESLKARCVFLESIADRLRNDYAECAKINLGLKNQADRDEKDIAKLVDINAKLSRQVKHQSDMKEELSQQLDDARKAIEPDSTVFKRGDVVICIDDEGSDEELQEMKHYKITACVNGGIVVGGMNMPWSPDRFRLVSRG